MKFFSSLFAFLFCSYGLFAGDFVITNARLVVEEVSPVGEGAEVLPEGKGAKQSDGLGKVVPLTAAVVETSSRFVFNPQEPIMAELSPEILGSALLVSPEALPDVGEGADVSVTSVTSVTSGGIGSNSLVEGFLGVSVGPSLGSSKGIPSALVEAFPEFTLGSKPKFVRFGEVW
jgi:hypothetical protein